jgi:serine/threonine-protein kinase
MSYIFKARQPSLDRYIVVKRLKDELLGNTEMLARFKREARALASVLHQNIAHVYDFVEAEKESYIVMEYIDGIDLSTVIEKVGHLPPLIAASVLLGLVRGTGFIHMHNLIHRDIKPSNVRITNRGTVKLMDFGIVMDTDNQGLTRPGMMVGSPQFLSPEQVLGDPLTPASDIFLLGIVFYEMLTGSRPFQDGGGETVFQKIREAKYIPARQMNPAVPRSLDKIVKRCLKKKPTDRYASCQDLAKELESYLGLARAGHTEDTILKYVDEEALLTPAAEYRVIEDRPTFGKSNFSILGAIGIAVAAFFLGAMVTYLVSRPAVQPTTPSGFPVAKSHTPPYQRKK